MIGCSIFNYLQKIFSDYLCAGTAGTLSFTSQHLRTAIYKYPQYLLGLQGGSYTYMCAPTHARNGENAPAPPADTAKPIRSTFRAAGTLNNTSQQVPAVQPTRGANPMGHLENVQVPPQPPTKADFPEDDGEDAMELFEKIHNLAEAAGALIEADEFQLAGLMANRIRRIADRLEVSLL